MHNLAAPRAASQPVWPLLLLIVALLLPVDIAVRRVVIPWSDVQRAWRRLGDWLTRHRPAQVLTPERAQGMSSLFAAKNRASADTRPAPPAVAPILTRPASEEPPEPKTPARPAARPASRGAEPAAPAAMGTSATLLAKKRSREKKE